MADAPDGRRRPDGRPSGRFRTERATSAGGVVYRFAGDDVEVVLCGRDEDGVWGLPKGTPEPGEDVATTAAREVSEETGLQVRIEEALGSIRYWFASAEQGVRFDKTVHYYLMSATGGSVDEHDDEFDRVEWVPLTRALKLVTYANERDVLEKAGKRLEARSAEGTPS